MPQWPRTTDPMPLNQVDWDAVAARAEEATNTLITAAANAAASAALLALTTTGDLLEATVRELRVATLQTHIANNTADTDPDMLRGDPALARIP